MVGRAVAIGRVRGDGLIGRRTTSSSRFSTPATSASAMSVCRTGSSSDVEIGWAPNAVSAALTLGNRSSRCLASMRRTADSSSSGQSGRASRIGAGACIVCACMTAKLDPVKGARPVSIS